jgi:hypothetical protein
MAENHQKRLSKGSKGRQSSPSWGSGPAIGRVRHGNRTVMSNRPGLNTLPRIAACYVALLLAIVAGLMFRPFSRILMGLLYGWLGLFFVFALAVFASCIVLSLAVANRALQRDPESGPMGRESGVYDRWLDG